MTLSTRKTSAGEAFDHGHSKRVDVLRRHFGPDSAGCAAEEMFFQFLKLTFVNNHTEVIPLQIVIR